MFYFPHIQKFNSDYIYTFLHTKFNSFTYNFQIESKITKSLYASGYLNYYEVVNTPLDYFIKSTNLTTSQLNSIQRALSVYDLHIGISFQDLTTAITKHSKNQYKDRVVTPILKHLHAQELCSQITLIHEQMFIYGEKAVTDNLDDKSLYLYYRYVRYL